MTRKLHRWPGLIAAILLIILSISGAALSVFPTLDRVSAPASTQGQTVAELAAMVQRAHPGIEQIKRAPSGKITVWWFEGDTPGSAVFDPTTGQDAGSADPSPVEQWLISFHRALFLDDTGRITMGVAAAAMFVLAVSGAFLMARRVGGWRNWFAKQRGPKAGRFHAIIARIALPFLLLSSFTAVWMVFFTFDLLPSDEAAPIFPAKVSSEVGVAFDAVPLFKTTSVAELRSLTFPMDGDPTDVYTLGTTQGEGYIDQGTGEMLAWAEPGPWTKTWEWIYLLHTGQGAALWGLILGLVVLSVPTLAVTGILSWMNGRKGRPRLRGMVSAARAETVVLVGSEGGSTWGFAATLAQELQGTGQSVHVGPLSGFAPHKYSAARRIIIMTATWGDGEAPASARGAFETLASATPTVPLAVLGFGDRSFPSFCAFGHAMEDCARETGWDILLPMDEIDRQSPQDFVRWGRNLGAALGLTLTLNHQPTPPRTLPLTLISRRDYGETMQAPAAILRFALPKVSLWDRLSGRGFGRFHAGDLFGIVPEGSNIPRYYSLASCSDDGFIEIAMRKHQGGLCSGQLINLHVGETVQGFLRLNADFKPDSKTTPLILIGAGTGIGPLAGFIRAQGNRRPVHLWFGARHPDTDMFFEQELATWSETGQLSGLRTAFSRCDERQYVQDVLRQDRDALQNLIASGAKIMVCGGRDMAQGVREALSEALAPIGLTTATLKSQERYVEDVY